MTCYELFDFFIQNIVSAHQTKLFSNNLGEVTNYTLEIRNKISIKFGSMSYFFGSYVTENNFFFLLLVSCYKNPNTNTYSNQWSHPKRKR